jgi:hypothetical protein
MNGLYSHYHESANVSVLCELLKRIGKEVLDPKRVAALKGADLAGQAPRKRKTAIRKQFKDSLEWDFLVAKESLPQILEKWERIKATQYSITHLETAEDDFGGLKPFVRAKTTKLSFDKDSSVDAVIKGLTRFFRTLSFKKATVEGVDEGGSDRKIDVTETPDWFGEVDYNVILGDSTLFDDSLHNSCMIKYLIECAKERRDYFGLEVK